MYDQLRSDSIKKKIRDRSSPNNSLMGEGERYSLSTYLLLIYSVPFSPNF